jgi:hypothetical protein
MEPWRAVDAHNGGSQIHITIISSGIPIHIHIKVKNRARIRIKDKGQIQNRIKVMRILTLLLRWMAIFCFLYTLGIPCTLI